MRFSIVVSLWEKFWSKDFDLSTIHTSFGFEDPVLFWTAVAAIGTVVAALVTLLTVLGGFGKWFVSLFRPKQNPSYVSNIPGRSADAYQLAKERPGVAC